MAGRLEHAPDEAADGHEITLANRDVDVGNLRRLLAWRDHAAFVALLELGDPAGVVAVMMRHQNVGEPPAGLLQRRLDGGGLGGIDRRRRPVRGVVKQDAVIVLEAREEVDLGRHRLHHAGRREEGGRYHACCGFCSLAPLF